jgi:YebC/PmpR family DNA-binding regulatory protein
MGRAFEYRRAAKEKRWDKMSKVFPKLAKSITMAAKESGPDPEGNAKLRTAIINAKAENMPKDNIDAAIKRASGKEADINEMNYEGKAPHGALIFIECASDNTNRTVANLKSYFNKSDGQIVPTGSLEFLFDRKTVIEFKKTEGMEMDEIELELIDAGLEELEVIEDNVFVYGGFTSFGTLATAIEKLGIEVTKASVQRIPNNPQEFSEEQMIDIEKLLDKIEDDEDVQSVYTNII